MLVSIHSKPTAPDAPILSGGASGTGLATLGPRGDVLDAWYPNPALGSHAHTASERLAPDAIPKRLGQLTGADAGVGTEVVAIRTTIADLNRPSVDAYDAYLRLHLLSHRVIRPRDANFEGILELLADVVWTNHGPMAAEGFADLHRRLRARGPVSIHSVGKIPRMVDYVIPSGVRIADGARVQLGAHLAPGTVVMPEGFVDYDAGTLGTAIIEGQVAAGVVIGDGSDVGGGIGGAAIAVGKRCLIGAKAELRISLGDDCVVEPRLHIAADTTVTRPDGSTVAARHLAGMSNIHLSRNSITGAIEVVPWHGDGVQLSAALYANN
jgi:2,3,4,5-tetrahydropyridine-2,6-dicarboxylate N-succinyltransferase